jgi:hypothetical protein
LGAANPSKIQGIRASQLLRSTIHEMIESAFELGTEGYLFAVSFSC